MSQALGTKEHPIQARGVGLVPWQIALKNDKSTYRSHGRNNARKIVSVHEELSVVRGQMERKGGSIDCHMLGSNRSGTSFLGNLQLRIGT